MNVKKIKGEVCFRVLNKNKEGVLMVKAENPSETERVSWDFFKKHFEQQEGHWYKLKETDEIKRINKMGKWFSERPFLLAIPSKPTLEYTMALGSSNSEFCKEFDSTPQEFLSMLDSYRKVLLGNPK